MAVIGRLMGDDDRSMGGDDSGRTKAGAGWKEADSWRTGDDASRLAPPLVLPLALSLVLSLKLSLVFALPPAPVRMVGLVMGRCPF